MDYRTSQASSEEYGRLVLQLSGRLPGAMCGKIVSHRRLLAMVKRTHHILVIKNLDRHIY